MKKALFCLAALALTTSALADTKISGTSVSYSIKTSEYSGGNGSMIFIDAPQDKTGRTYAAFICDSGDTRVRLYSKIALGAFSGQQVKALFKADGNFTRWGTLTVREDAQYGGLKVLELNEQSLDAFRLFLLAKNKVAVRVERGSLGVLDITLPVKGFSDAYRAVNTCDD